MTSPPVEGAALRRILIVEDQRLVREGMRLLLARLTAWQVLEAGTLAAAERMLRAAGAELVVLDYYLPDGQGVEALARIHDAAPGALVIVVSAADDGPTVRAAIEAGARGYVPKTSSGELLLGAIQTVLAGGTYVPREALERVDGARPLTERQRKILSLVVQGQVNQEIAATIGASESTVRAHLTTIYRQLGVRNRAQAVQVAIQRRLV